MLLPVAVAQQTPPPPPTSANVVPQRTPGLTPELADASRLIGEGAYAPALAKIDAVLATDAKNPQARFLKGVVQTDQADIDAAITTFQALNEDYPELPEPYNNLAVIWAQRGEYDKARRALEIALVTRPGYAIAHENLADIYVRLAGVEYERAIALDKANKGAQSKLTLVRDLFAFAPSGAAPKAAATQPTPAATQPTPAAPQPNPAEPQPAPAAPQPTPAQPQPTPATTTD
jgi:tetratricopeptide (TPR) repeat protein